MKFSLALILSILSFSAFASPIFSGRIKSEWLLNNNKLNVLVNKNHITKVFPINCISFVDKNGNRFTGLIEDSWELRNGDSYLLLKSLDGSLVTSFIPRVGLLVDIIENQNLLCLSINN